MSISVMCSKQRLSVGQRVCVKGNNHGTLQYLGDINFAEGLWCGIELDEALGENDGMINNIRYFTCKKNFGLFVPFSEISPSSNVTNASESCSNNSVFKQLKNSSVYQSCNFGIQKSDTLGNNQPNSSEKYQTCVLNESYTISNGFREAKSLSAIVEEDIDNMKFSDSTNISSFYLSTLNKCKSNDKIILHQDFPSTDKILPNVINTVMESGSNDFTDSDESLGILPSNVIEDSWDELMWCEENNVNLNTTVNLPTNMDMKFDDCKKNMPDNIYNEVFSPISHMPNVSLLCNQVAESPVQSDKSLPKYASTPKHETNFPDVCNEIENDLNMTHNLSSEFQIDQTLLENETCSTNLLNANVSHLNITQDLEKEYKDEKYLTHIPMKNKDLNATHNLENVAENCLNVTFEKELYKNSNVFCVKSDNECKISMNQIQENPAYLKSEEILNTTYEKECEFSDLNVRKNLKTSKQSMLSTEDNMKSLRYTVKSRNSKINFTGNASFSKDNKSKFERNKLRKSVGCFGSESVPKPEIFSKQVRRNSMSNSFNTSSKENFPKTQVLKSFHSRNLSNKNSVKQSCVTSLMASKKSFSKVVKDVSISLKHSTLKYDSLNTKSKIKSVPKTVLHNNQKCVLNETINLLPPPIEVGKTVVKKSRSYPNFACHNSSFENHDTNLRGSSNKMACGKKMIPSKSGRVLRSSEVQCKVADNLNETILIDRKIKEPPIIAVNLDNGKSKIARFQDNHLSSEKSTSLKSSLPSIGIKQTGLNKGRIKPPSKPVIHNKVDAGHCSTPTKSINYPSKQDSNDVIVSDQSCAMQINEGFKTVYINRKAPCQTSRETLCNFLKPQKINLNASVLLCEQQSSSRQNVAVSKLPTKRHSSIPLSKIPSIPGCKFQASTESTVSSNMKVHDEKEVPSHRMTLRRRVSTIPIKK